MGRVRGIITFFVFSWIFLGGLFMIFYNRERMPSLSEWLAMLIGATIASLIIIVKRDYWDFVRVEPAVPESPEAVSRWRTIAVIGAATVYPLSIYLFGEEGSIFVFSFYFAACVATTVTLLIFIIIHMDDHNEDTSIDEKISLGICNER